MNNQMSDLDMVAQAMATTTRLPSDQTDAPRPHHTASDVPNDTPSESASTTNGNNPELPADIAAGLAKLSEEDKASLGPLLELLVTDGSDEKDLEDLLKQFDAADDVGDKLEGRLDSLLEGLKGVEGELGAGAGTGHAGKEGED